MKDILYNVVEMLFSKIPFSKKSEQLKETLNQKLVCKYQKEITDENEIETAGKLISNCQSIESLCELVDYPMDDIMQYKEITGCIDKKGYTKIIKKLKRYNLLISVFVAIIFLLFINIICYFELSYSIYNLILIIAHIVIVYLIIKRKKKYTLHINYINAKFDRPTKQYIYDLNDKYTKKLINTLLFAIAIMTYFSLDIIVSILFSKYTYLDVLGQVAYISGTIQIVIFLIVKHYLNKVLTDQYFVESRRDLFYRYLKGLLKYSGVYFVITMIVLGLLRSSFSDIYNWIIIFLIIYFIGILTFNLTIRKDIVFKNMNVNIKRIVVVSLCVVCVSGYNIMSMDTFLTQPFINKVSQVLQEKDDIVYDEDTGVYTVTTQKEDFKILQLTDIHLGGSFGSYTKDIKALEACYKLIKHAQPDLVVVTGDLVFPMGIMSFSLNNNAPIMQFANFMRNTGIPWTFTYGNHDTEGMATLDRDRFDNLMKSLSFKTSANLLYPYIQPDIYGRSNQMVEIRNKNGKLMQALFLLDSNDYLQDSTEINEYDYIHDDQVKWYEKNVLALSKKEGYTIPSTIFFHIPLREYITANNLYEKGNKEVKYYYGTLGEKMMDKICASEKGSTLFETAVRLNSTKAMFFGHDHYNNQSLEYKGIRMTYGYSIDYLAMPGIQNAKEQRGATGIIIKQDGSFVIEPYRLVDIE